jgi:hypothetical protein
MHVRSRVGRLAARSGLFAAIVGVLTLLAAPAALAADPVEPVWSNLWNAKSPGVVEGVKVVRSAKSDIFTACSILRPAVDKYDVVIAKYRPDGTRKWVRSWSRGTDVDEWVEGIATDADGNLIVCGWFNSGKAGTPDWFVLKYDRAGYLMWTKTTSGLAKGDDRAVDVVVNSKNRIFVTGYITQATGGKDWRTVKYTPKGDTAWARNYKGADQLDDQPMAMAIDVDRNIYVTGMVGSAQTNRVRSDAVTIKYKPDGTAEWVMPFNMHYEESGVDIAVRKSGVVVAVKAVDEAGEYTFAYGLQYTRAGELVFSPSMDDGNTLVDRFLCAGIDSSARAVFSGFSVHESTGDSTARLMQYNAEGTSEWSFALTGAGNAPGDQFNKVFVAVDGTVWATGRVGGAAVTVSLDAAGAERWNAAYDAAAEIDSGDAMAVTSKSVYVAGTSGASLVLIRYKR